MVKVNYAEEGTIYQSVTCPIFLKLGEAVMVGVYKCYAFIFFSYVIWRNILNKEVTFYSLKDGSGTERR